MMKKEIKIGIFAIVVLFCLYWGINFLKGRDLFRRNNIYYAYYENVSGIQLSAPVIVRGINVGSVVRIEFKPELDNMVELQLSIKSKYDIPENSAVRMTSSLIGGKSLEIELGDSEEYLKDGATIRAESEVDIFDLAGSEWDAFKQQGSQVVKQINATLTQLNELLASNTDNITGIIADIRSSTDALNHMISDKNGHVQSILADVNVLSTTLAENGHKIDSIMTNIRDISGELNESDLKALVTQLDQTVTGINELIEGVNQGEGTLGMFLHDTALYDSLAQASADLSALLQDVKENPKRYVNISVFGGGKKNK